MNARTTLAVIAGAALAFALTSSPAFACPSGEALDNYILPTLPKSIDADAIVLKVLLKKIPDWRAQLHHEANMSVLGVVKGSFLGRSIWLAIRPKGSCEIVGVVGRPGYVVVKHYPSGWIVSPYRVVRGRTTTPGAAEIPFDANVPSPPVADTYFDAQSGLMTLKQLGRAFGLGASAAFVSFLPMRAVLIAWYMHEAPRDGLSGLGVIAGSLYFALLCGAITFGILLTRSRRRS